MVIKTKATIHLNAWKVAVGVNSALSNWLNNKLELCVSFDSWDLGYTANKEVWLDSCWLGLPWIFGTVLRFSGTKSINWLECFWAVCTPSEYGAELNSTINPDLHSESNMTISFSWIDIILRALNALWIDPTISWSLGLAWVTIIIAGSSWAKCSKRFCPVNAVVIAKMWAVKVAETIVIIGMQSCKEISIAGSLFGIEHCFAGLSFVSPLKSSFLMDATTKQYVKEGLPLKSKA